MTTYQSMTVVRGDSVLGGLGACSPMQKILDSLRVNLGHIISSTVFNPDSFSISVVPELT